LDDVVTDLRGRVDLNECASANRPVDDGTDAAGNKLHGILSSRYRSGDRSIRDSA
jgi:hypothetical protein